jgi:hypothetical protein
LFGGSLFGCGLGGKEFGAFGGDEGESLDQSPDVVLHPLDQPFGHQPPGPRSQRVDQSQHGDPESLGWGEGWGLVHALFLRCMAGGGQGEK